jgi:serine/threonine-protein kinase
MKLTSANGLLMGTPAYMSPEALRGAEMTAASDQYSLGVVLYECATGINPFACSTFAETVRLITTGEHVRPSAQNPALSRRLESIIERALSLEPEDRFEDVRALGRELLSLAGQRTRLTWGLSFGDTTSLIPAEHTRKLTERLTHARAEAAIAKSRPSRRRLQSILAVVIPLGLLASGLVRYSGNKDASNTASSVSSAPVAGESLEAAPAGIQVPLNAVDSVAAGPLMKDLGDLAKALDPQSGDDEPSAPQKAAPSAAVPSAAAPAGARPRLQAAAGNRERAPAARPTASHQSKATPRPTPRATPSASGASKPRPWWLPEPEKPSRKRPGTNGVGANSAPIFD